MQYAVGKQVHNITNQSARRYVGRGFCGCLLLASLLVSTPLPTQAAVGVEESWWGKVAAQLDAVWQVASETVARVFDGQSLQAAQIGGAVVDSNTLASLERATGGTGIFPSDPVERIVFNTDLLVGDDLVVRGGSQLATTTVTGAAAISGQVSATALTVDTEALIAALTVDTSAVFNGQVLAVGGIDTGGANVDLGTGEIYASNIVNALVAGENISITGSPARPVISAAFAGVTSLGGETGELELEAGDDIDIDDLEISNESTLDSVRDRGGCDECIEDDDVAEDLTIRNGNINATPIGFSSRAAAYFTQVSIGTSSTQSGGLRVANDVLAGGLITATGAGTSTFASTINVTDGCFAIDGTCITAPEIGTYLGLSDTPSAYESNAIAFVNASGTAMTQDRALTFDATDLSLGSGIGLALDGTRVLYADNSGDTVALGELAWQSGVGTEGTYIGSFAGTGNSGDRLVALGYASGAGNQGDDNLLLGYVTGGAMTGDNNIALGVQAGYNQASSFAELIGYEAGGRMNATNSVVVGSLALRGGSGSVFSGATAGTRNNVVLGYRAGYNAQSGADNNLLLGYQAADSLTTGSNNIIIGYDVEAPSSTGSHQLNIGNLLFGTGLDGTGTTMSTGNVGIGTSTPASRLSVVGDVSVTGGCVRVDGTCLGGAAELTALNDVTLATTSAGDLLQYDGAEWVNVASSTLGFGDGTYTGLSDTPSSLVAGAVQFANATTSGLTQSSNFVFDGTNLSIGGGAALSSLTVAGDISLADENRLRFYSAGNSNYVGFRASSSLASNVTWTLPVTDGAEDTILVTDGSGNLRFAPVGTVGGGSETYVGLTDTPNSLAANTIPYVNASSSALLQSSNLAFDGTNLALGGATPSSELSVKGDVTFFNNDDSAGIFFGNGSGRVGVGTAVPAEQLEVLGGSLLQRGGTAAAPYTPNQAGSVDLDDGSNDVALQGKYAYVVSRTSGDDFTVVDISDRTNPMFVAGINLPTEATSVNVVGDYAYVTTLFTGDDFHIIDISDPSNPVQVGSLDLPTDALGVAIEGNFAYVVTDNLTDEFHVVDITNKTSPFITDSLSLADQANAVVVNRGYAYVATNESGDDIHVIDVASSTAVSEVGSLNMADSVSDLAVSRDTLYAVTNSDGDDFHIIDISDPLTLNEVGSLNLDSSGLGLSVVGDYAYVTTLSAGDDLHIVDISDPASPVRTGSANIIAGNANAVAVRGSYIVVATSGAGDDMVVFDIPTVSGQSAQFASAAVGQVDIDTRLVNAGRTALEGQVYIGSNGLRVDSALEINSSAHSHFLGAVSIGTTSNNGTLTVAGAVQSSDLLGGATNLTTDSNGNIIRDPSDVRLKEDISTIDEALSTLLQLRGVRYKWRDTERFGEQVEIGFIAQEVEAVLPEVVRTGGDYWSLNTRNIVAVVVEAVKELWGTIQTTQADVADLKAQVDTLQAEVARLASSSDESAAVESTTVPSDEQDDSNFGLSTSGSATATVPNDVAATNASTAATTTVTLDTAEDQRTTDTATSTISSQRVERSSGDAETETTAANIQTSSSSSTAPAEMRLQSSQAETDNTETPAAVVETTTAAESSQAAASSTGSAE